MQLATIHVDMLVKPLDSSIFRLSSRPSSFPHANPSLRDVCAAHIYTRPYPERDQFLLKAGNRNSLPNR